MSRNKDIDLRLLTNPITNDLTVLEDEFAIRNSIKNLVLLNIGERHFRNIGSDILSFLFELVDPLVSDAISQKVLSLIKLFEPRVSDVRIGNVSSSENEIRLEVRYRTTQEPAQIKTFPLIIQKAR